MSERIRDPRSGQFTGSVGDGKTRTPKPRQVHTGVPRSVHTSVHKRDGGSDGNASYFKFLQDGVPDDALALKLTSSDNPLVRLSLARNIYLDPAVYVLLAQDSDPKVVEALNTNPSYRKGF